MSFQIKLNKKFRLKRFLQEWEHAEMLSVKLKEINIGHAAVFPEWGEADKFDKFSLSLLSPFVLNDFLKM
jgi:hypothetical protein